MLILTFIVLSILFAVLNETANPTRVLWYAPLRGAWEVPSSPGGGFRGADTTMRTDARSGPQSSTRQERWLLWQIGQP